MKPTPLAVLVFILMGLMLLMGACQFIMKPLAEIEIVNLWTGEKGIIIPDGGAWGPEYIGSAPERMGEPGQFAVFDGEKLVWEDPPVLETHDTTCSGPNDNCTVIYQIPCAVSGTTAIFIDDQWRVVE